MRWFYAMTLCLLLSGCVASTEVKQASAQVGVALAQLQRAQADFRDVYIDELEEVRELAGRSIVADAVVSKVGDMKQEEIDGDLISISTAIAEERRAYREFVDQILDIRLKAGQSDEDAVTEVIMARAAALLTSAAALEAAGMDESAAELLERAIALEGDPSDLESFDDMVNLVVLAQTQEDVRTGIRDLQQYVDFLRMIHKQVDEWIGEDVIVKGKDIADLIARAENKFGPADGGSR